MVWDHEVAGSNPATPTATPHGISGDTGVATTRPLTNFPLWPLRHPWVSDARVFLPHERACSACLACPVGMHLACIWCVSRAERRTTFRWTLAQVVVANSFSSNA